MNNDLILFNSESIEKGLTFCSIDNGDIDNKITMYNAVNNPDYKISDFINKTISIKDLYVTTIETTDKNTGEIIKLPFIVIIDKDNKSYSCASFGILSALKKITDIFGYPTYSPELYVKVEQHNTKNGNKVLNLVPVKVG